MNLKATLAAAIALSFAAPTVSYATNGYLLHGYGKNKGTGGAGIANPRDALAAATNPAGTVWVEDRFDMYGELFHPRRGYDIDANDGGVNAGNIFSALQGGEGDKVKSEKDVFLIPAMGFVSKIDDVSAWGVSVYGAGLGSEYNRDETTPLGGAGGLDGTFGTGSTGVDLLLIMSNFNYSRKITENSSWGIGLILAAQSFKAKGLQAFNLASFGNLGEKERDWAFGYGMNFGAQAEVFDGFTVAGSYQTEIGLRHEAYNGLFANDGDLSLPRQWTIGATWKPNKTSSLSFDVQRIYWSETASIGNNFQDFIDPVTGIPNPLGAGDAAGFGWEDSTVFKLGYEWQMAMLPSWTWRAGYAYQDQIVPETETLFGTLAPGVIKHHYTFGFSKEFDDGNELTMNMLYAPKELVRGAGFSEGVDIYLEEYGLELGYSWKFN
ncbi:MAG: hypothetical protein HN790_12915 [Methylococcales bacterium]|jgi:long-chain fatty acid transport protein|nr:hypothetical protein [Methylococcales bacterium]